MFHRRRTILILAAIGLFSALFAIAANVATSTLTESLPAEWKPRVPLIAWGAVAIIALLLIGLTIWHYLQEHPAAQPAAPDAHNRAQMLEKVRATWMPLLDETLQDVVRIELGLKSSAALVDDPRKRLHQPNRPERLLPPGTPIHALFDDLAGELLILGAPGAGKTTMLLELARVLLDRASQDAAHPIPVVFNLSTWAEQHPPLAAWLVDELSKRYDVPRRIGQTWVDANAILPLLDGLDEVALEQRAACVEAVNHFHQQHGPIRLVVCSRIADYQALLVRLRLQGAVVVQPLALDQVDAALERAGAQLEAVRIALRDDVVLQELAETALLLSIMILAYRGYDSRSLASFDTLEARREHLFAAYVATMFQRRGEDARYPQAWTLRWLRCLARGMVEHSQTVFYIEQLQPDWLARRQRRGYEVGVGVSIGLVFGLGGGLVFGFLKYGGMACIRHLVLRILLYRNGAAPWNYARFLDYAAERILLRKVGGGYIFVHRMLMEYFAALEPTTAPAAKQSAGAPPSQ